MRSRILVLAFVPLLLGSGALARAQSAAPDAAVAAIIEEGLQRSKVMDHLDHLTNRIGPRLTSSDRLTQACEWAAETLAAMGLDARLEPWGTFPVGFNRGPAYGRMVRPREMTFTFGTAAWSAGTKGRVRGAVVLAPLTEEELEKAKETFAGRWVLEPQGPERTLRPPRDRRNPVPRDERLARGMQPKIEAACREAGALGIIRSTGGALVRTGGDHRVAFDDLPDLCIINMVDDDWHAIAREVKAGTDPELEFDVRNNFKKGPIQLFNVVADLKGSEIPDEYVIVGGHIDSWDGATGTTDNGTGTSSTIEAARILTAAGARPKRTIRFMLWSGEEQGLLGSRAYVEAHPELMPKISAVFVHDGGTNYVAGIGCLASQREDLERVFAPVAALDQERLFEVRTSRGMAGGGASDHASFIQKGVPGFFWDQKGRAQYGHGWHTQNDTYDLAIPEYQRHTATVAAVGAYGVANLDHLLSREGMGGGGRELGIATAADGLKVEAVTEGKPAAVAGVKVGDVIVGVDDREVTALGELRRALGRRRAPEKLVVLRDGARLELPLTFPE